MYLEKLSPINFNNIDLLINNLKSLSKFIDSDKIFAHEFYAKGGKKILINYIKESEQISDANKW